MVFSFDIFNVVFFLDFMYIFLSLEVIDEVTFSRGMKANGISPISSF